MNPRVDPAPRPLLSGATGAVGGAIRQRYLEASWAVTGVSRRASGGGDFISWDPLAGGPEGLEALRSAGPFAAVCWAQGANISDQVRNPDRVRHMAICEADVLFIVLSLPRAQLIEGLCEAVKICFASQDDSFERYLSEADQLPSSGDPAALARIIAITLAAKRRFVEEDEFDTGIRLLLNFGHTFGHALEGASRYRISHGVAVGLGMLASAAFSEAKGLLPRGQTRARELLEHVRRLLREIPGLDGVCGVVDVDDCLRRFASDKKHGPTRFQSIAIGADGRPVRHGIARDADGEACIRAAFEPVLGEFSEVQ